MAQVLGFQLQYQSGACVMSLLSFTQGFFLLFVLTMIIPLRCSQETKTGYLPVNRGLIVNFSTEAHQSFISGKAERRLADCKCPVWSLSTSSLICLTSYFWNILVFGFFTHLKVIKTPKINFVYVGWILIDVHLPSWKLELRKKTKVYILIYLK